MDFVCGEGGGGREGKGSQVRGEGGVHPRAAAGAGCGEEQAQVPPPTLNSRSTPPPSPALIPSSSTLLHRSTLPHSPSRPPFRPPPSPPLIYLSPSPPLPMPYLLLPSSPSPLLLQCGGGGEVRDRRAEGTYGAAGRGEGLAAFHQVDRRLLEWGTKPSHTPHLYTSAPPHLYTLHLHTDYTTTPHIRQATPLHPTPCTSALLHLYILQPTPYTSTPLPPTPFTSTPITPHPAPYALHQTPATLRPTPFSLHTSLLLGIAASVRSPSSLLFSTLLKSSTSGFRR